MHGQATPSFAMKSLMRGPCQTRLSVRHSGRLSRHLSQQGYRRSLTLKVYEADLHLLITSSMAGNLMLLSVLAGLSLINAQNITSAASTYSTVTFNLAATTSTPLSTAVPSATGAATATLGNYALPINQSWCASPIYCPGEILQAVQLSGIYADGKTFVDKPTLQSEQVVVNAFQAVKQNGTVAALINWIDTYFGPEGSDVLAVNLTDFQENPPFLPYVKDPILQGWLKIGETGAAVRYTGAQIINIVSQRLLAEPGQAEYQGKQRHSV